MNDATRHRPDLPQTKEGLFLTDGGIETSLIFHRGIELPHFAAFHLLGDDKKICVVENYYSPYLEIAQRLNSGFILETITWRASSDWGAKLGYSKATLAEANRQAVAINESLRAERGDKLRSLVLSGCVGPRGDGYVPSEAMSSDAAQRYHEEQIGTLANTSIDLITAATMNNSAEAIGIVRAARDAGMPVVISFTLETDGHLPTGQRLEDAIASVDRSTDGYASYFGVNCAHPSHFAHLFSREEIWSNRIRAIRANASKKSHAELELATELDEGNPEELGDEYVGLKSKAPQLNILGGCCGTDHRHVEAVATKCMQYFGSE